MSRVKKIAKLLAGMRLPANQHLAAISAIQAAGSSLLQKEWCTPDNRGCLAIVAAAAITGTHPSAFMRWFSNEENLGEACVTLATLLGLSENDLYTMVEEWDHCTPRDRNAVLRKLNRVRHRLERKAIFSRTPVRDDQLADMRALLGNAFAGTLAPATKEVIQVSAC